MEVIHNSSFDSPPKTVVNLEQEPGDLLEKSWFFGNLLDRRTRMSRCYSDPGSSSSSSKPSNEDQDQISSSASSSSAAGKSYEETYSSLKKLPPQGPSFGGGGRPGGGLMRTPSLPEESTHQRAKGRNFSNNDKGGKPAGLLRQQSTANYNLLRAPSMPTSLVVKDEIHDEESEFSMSKLIRQASLKTPEVLPHQDAFPSWAVAQSSNTPPRNRQMRRKTELESSKTESPVEAKVVRSNPLIRTKLERSTSDFSNELKGLKNLSLKWDNNKDSLRVGSSRDDNEVKKYSSYEHQQQQQQGWLSRNNSLSPSSSSSSSSMDKRSAEDMKEQIKFWARAVASNVRQEC
ncbi:OLC1v1023149C2 [Oldenlandia corymbosa var. corymbosa]|uniref:OLC1v1023149C2 n=1 Tax=Oldenlandia corymbosa var. corymbosa TaxID=529605 RepID=A0AAV1C0P8_OLDCO|nr:OLC1v1023149C2 [Oldenlandia corymbosa var. corymbosa]